MKAKNFIERFNQYAVPEPNTGCLLWTGFIDKKGYGKITFNQLNYKKTTSPHRLSYETFVSPVPDSLDVLHSCDTPSYVNPNHLFLGTAKENIQDCINKKRGPQFQRKTHCKRGHELKPYFCSKKKTKTKNRCLVCQTIRKNILEKERSDDRHSSR